MKILNLTQHKATQDQLDQGVFDLPEGLRSNLACLLTFASIPTWDRVDLRVETIVRMVKSNSIECTHAMIGGAPFLMSALERHLHSEGIMPMFAFSERVSEETVAEDGTVTKVNVFKHIGFVGL